MSLGRYRPWGQSQEKIRPEHRDRAAAVLLGSPRNGQVRASLVCGRRR